MEVGQQLFEARQRNGLTLEEISRTTKIPVSVLYAIERNDERHLPQKFFTRAFIRTYATQVGLNADDLLDKYVVDEHVDPLPVAIAEQDASPSRSFILVAVAAVCSIYFGYTLQQTPESAPNAPEAAVTEPAHTVAADDRGDITLPAAEPVVVQAIAAPRATMQNARRDAVAASAASPVVAPVEVAAPLAHTLASDEPSIAAPVAREQALPVLSDTLLPQPDVAPAPPAAEF